MISNKGRKNLKPQGIAVLLDNIRSVHNAGSIFRTAETLGVSKIVCIGTTPVPVDRFGRKRGDFAKVALGAEDIISWEHVPDESAAAFARKLKKEGYRLIALEQAKGSVDYKDVEIALDATNGRKSSADPKFAVIFGNEVEGVSSKLLKEADIVAEIPMRGKKESLNVSVAAGIFLFRLFDRK